MIGPLDCLCDEGDDLGIAHPNCPAHGENRCPICSSRKRKSMPECARCRSGKLPRLTPQVLEGLRIVEKLAWADIEAAEADDESEYRYGAQACRWIRRMIAIAENRAGR